MAAVEGFHAVSIRQPWAWAIVRPDLPAPNARAYARQSGRIKDIENRDWATKHRGRLLIHAAKTIDVEAIAAIRRRFPLVPVPDPAELRIGGIVGVAILRDVVDRSPSPWFAGPKGWVLADSRPVPFVPYRGRPGIFRVDLSEDEAPGAEDG